MANNGDVNLPQVSISGSVTDYSGIVTNRYGNPIPAKVLLFSVDDNTLIDSVVVGSSGRFSFSTPEPGYIVSLPDADNMNGLGWGKSYG